MKVVFEWRVLFTGSDKRTRYGQPRRGVRRFLLWLAAKQWSVLVLIPKDLSRISRRSLLRHFRLHRLPLPQLISSSFEVRVIAWFVATHWFARYQDLKVSRLFRLARKVTARVREKKRWSPFSGIRSIITWFKRIPLESLNDGEAVEETSTGRTMSSRSSRES